MDIMQISKEIVIALINNDCISSATNAANALDEIYTRAVETYDSK